VGNDADIAIWNPARSVKVSDSMMHDQAGFTPYAGRIVTGWPDTVLLRAGMLIDGEQCQGQPGDGRLLLRKAGEAATPFGRLAIKADEGRTIGATLIYLKAAIARN